MIEGPSTTVIDSALVALAPTASVATRVKVVRPLVVGVPVISPVAGSMLSPAGSEPVATDQV